MPRDWERYYRETADLDWTPAPLVAEAAEWLAPGRALDLACGAGRNALYLAQLGWRVTAVDRSAAAIRRLRERAGGAAIDARVADLERGEFTIERDAYDLICDIRYLQRDLFPSIREGVRPGGAVIAVLRLEGSFALGPGELREEFAGWKILFYSESPEGGCPLARLVARRA